MIVKQLIVAAGFALSLSPALVFADDTKMCDATQQARCDQFCQTHQDAKSCIVDVTTKSGTCTCNDGTSHTKS